MFVQNSRGICETKTAGRIQEESMSSLSISAKFNEQVLLQHFFNRQEQ